MKNTQQLTIPNNNLNFKLFLFHIFCRCKLLASMGFDGHPEAVNLDERAGAFAAKVVSKTMMSIRWFFLFKCVRYRDSYGPSPASILFMLMILCDGC